MPLSRGFVDPFFALQKDDPRNHTKQRNPGSREQRPDQKLNRTRTLTCRLPPLPPPPPPGPKKKIAELPFDFRKYGEAILPMGAPRLV